MIRRLTIVGLVSLLLLTNILYAEGNEGTPPMEDIESSLTVVMDCISASLVTECTDSNITLPCSNVSMEDNAQLPRRIAYFLADPSEFVNAMTPADQGLGFFASLRSLLYSATENPLVSAVYVSMATREYSPGDFLLSGSITFDYPEGATLEDILEIWSSRKNTGESIGLSVDMNVFGRGLTTPIALAGEFDMSVDDYGNIVVRSIDTYTINGFAYRGGEFKM